MLDLDRYPAAHRHTLQALLATPEWKEALDSGLVEAVRRERLSPGKPRDFITTVVDALLAHNGDRVRARISEGARDADALLDDVARWPREAEGRPAPLAFVGLNLTAECNLSPRCLYCNQPYVTPSLELDAWKRIIDQVTDPGDAEGPYLYVTGGEPLLLEEALWGPEGLVRYATARGAAVNVNTNATLITPRVALALIAAGLLRLHISLDTPDPARHAGIRGRPGLEAALRGIYHVQLARELVGVDYPGIHTNCVLTKRNLERVPELLAFILRIRKVCTDPDDPLYNDLFPHVIPVGGASNLHLRPTEEGFRRFVEVVWPRVAALWEEHQAAMGVPPQQRRALFGYFSNPYLRVEHRGGLEAYARTAAHGRYGERALALHCYVAPTQAAFTPDGTQYRCGSHAIRHLQPLGRADGGDVFANIRRGLDAGSRLPDPDACHGCALATLYINQAVEERLRGQVREWMER